MQRRGFLQLLGLGATGAVSGLPLFGKSALASPLLPFISGHLILQDAKVDGVAYPIQQNGAAEGIRFSDPFGRMSFLRGAETRWIREDLSTPEDSMESLYYAFHARAKQLQQRLHADALELLQELATVKVDPGTFGFEGFDVPVQDPLLHLPLQLVTIPQTPLSGLSWIKAGFTQYLVYGRVEGVVLSTTGEYPIDESLDLDRLIWIDQQPNKYLNW